MALKIYNTFTRSKEVFEPLVTGKINMYVCGMTVYDYCHLGHARVMVAFDVITRYLRNAGYEVNYVRNITDIEDKILNRANENKELYTDLTSRFIDFMHQDEARLGVQRPDQEPRATEFIEEIINMVQTLIEKGYAYAADNGDIYYSVDKFGPYGQLSNKNPDELLAGARVDVELAKKDPRDFVLWKSTTADEVHWDSPWGKGRPGWHIECSAMSTCCLGNTFDIHGGGPDLPFPHHENEIAQSEAATGEKYARYWMHAGAVRIDGEKMSKSLGNFFTIREILDKYHPEVVRYCLIGSHYRSAINYSEESLQTAKTALDRFYKGLKGFEAVQSVNLADLVNPSDYITRFHDAMQDDFNTPVALAVMFDLVRELNTAVKDGSESAQQQFSVELKSLGALLGLLQSDPTAFLQAGGDDELSAGDIEAKIQARVEAKANKDYALSDQIRDDLKEQGVILEDTGGQTTWRRG
ncbi:MAG: cysteinyl-tRNA synthetase [Pseudohongiellaceae bacterium]|jgi:cysteinyl-tRNA synthetase